MAGYTRQDTANNIANGNVIDADDFDAEYNAVESAFNASAGHKHDGTAGEGAPITKVGPSQDIIVSATNVNPKTTNTLDLGVSTGVKFKDGYFQGTLVGETAVKAGTNRYMTLTDNELDVSTGDLTLDVEGNIVIDANGGDITLKDDGTTFGGISNFSGQTVIKSGATPTTAIIFSDADATLAGNTTLSGTLDVTGDINFNSTTTSTTKTTGAVIVDGGVGIAENVNIGGDVAIDGDLTVSGVGKNITGDLIGDLKAVDGTSVLDSGTDGTDATFTGDVTGDLTGNADTATTWATAREIALTGDVTGTVTGVNGGGDISITTTIAADSVALGTDTTGNYVSDVTAGTGVTVTNTPAEGSSPIIAIGQAVETNSNVQFNNVTVDGNLTVGGTTTTVNSTTVTVADPIFTLGGDTDPEGDDNKDRGIEFRYHDGTSAKVGFFGFDDSAGKFTFIPDAINTSEVFSGTAGTIVAGTFEGALTGDVTAASSSDLTLSTDEVMVFKSADTSNVGNPVFNFQHTSSANVAAPPQLNIKNTDTATSEDQLIGAFSFVAADSLGNYVDYATFKSTILDNDSGQRDGSFVMTVSNGGTNDFEVFSAGGGQSTIIKSGVGNISLKAGTTAMTNTAGTGTLTFTPNSSSQVISAQTDLRLTGTDIRIDATTNVKLEGTTTDVFGDLVLSKGTSDWKVTVNGSNELVISYAGVNKMKLDSSGNLTVTGNVTAYGTV